MPLAPETIESASRRYRREYDCYLKLSRFVADKCESGIIRENTLRASVTHRAKAPHKFTEKLQKKYRNEEDLNSVDEAIGRVTDLAGVRISAYLEGDRKKIVEEIRRMFDGPEGGEVEIDDKDDAPGRYRATHCQVRLKEEDLVDPYENLQGLTCEIQVCSLLAHVWNEISHDLAYKPTTGELSATENESLEVLADLTVTGDRVIKLLFDANAERLNTAKEDEAPFQDVYDFVARMRDEFDWVTDFGRNAGQLFEDLMALNLSTPAKIKEVIVQDDKQSRAEMLGKMLEENSPEVDYLKFEPNSSDALLLLLLDIEGYPDKVLSLHEAGRGRGRPPRIASFTRWFSAAKEAQQVEINSENTAD